MAVLDGKAVVVTGAGRGLGRAYALDAAAHGAAVVVNDIDRGPAEEVVREITAAGGRAMAAGGSVAEWSFAESLVQTCVSAYGKLDGLVNNAGLFYTIDPWEDSEARIRRLVEVNVLGTMYCGVHALRQMVAQRSGSLVNITSGAHAGISLMAAYGASKGAAASFTYSTAVDVAKHNVRVNAVSPIGATRMGTAIGGVMSDEAPESPAARRDGSALGVAPETVAPLVTFLLSDLAHGITGQVVRMQDHSLSLFEHPIIVEPTLEQPHWTPESISAAFDSTLRARLRPVGMGAKTYTWG